MSHDTITAIDTSYMRYGGNFQNDDVIQYI